MITVTDHAEGCILSVRAQPGAKRNAVVGEQAGSLKVAVAAPPENGRANKALIEVLAKALQVKRGQLELISGHTHREKKLLIRDISAHELQELLKDFF